MRKLSYTVQSTRLMGVHDAAYLSADDDLATAVAESVVSSLSTEVMIQLGDVKIHLAALLDPDHWETDWEAAGVDDVDEFLAGLVTDG